MADVYIRPLVMRDISGAADAFTTAFMDDELMEIITPKRQQCPLSWRRNTTARLATRLVQPGCWGYVAVPSAAPQDQDKIMGYAFYERRAGSSEIKKTDPWSCNHPSWADALNRTLLNLENRWDIWVRGNPAIDYDALAGFLGPNPDNDSAFAPIENGGITHWHLSALSVHTAYQRRGVGSALVRFGIDLARKETRESGVPIPVSLVASVAGNKLYKTLGFRVVHWMTLPNDDVRRSGGAAMVWDETGTWIQPAPEGEMKKGYEMGAVWTQKALDALESKKARSG